MTIRLPPEALTVRNSPAKKRLLKLERDHAQLLRQISKRNSALLAAQQHQADLQHQVNTEYRPLLIAKKQLLNALKESLAHCLAQSPPFLDLSRKDQARMRRQYAPFLSNLSPESEATFPDEQASSPPPPTEHPSAAKLGTTEGSSLRSIFRRLAVALHPDREQQGLRRDQLTELMKAVTVAYNDRDLASLVKIERQWLVGHPASGAPSDHNLASTIKQLHQQNGELRSQLRTLTARLKPLKPNPSATEKGLYQLREDIEVLKQQLAFTEGFLAGTVSKEQFLSATPGH